jgi:hypothetical protein
MDLAMDKEAISPPCGLHHSFLHLVDYTILKSLIISIICGSKFSHQLFTLVLVRDILQEAGRGS